VTSEIRTRLAVAIGSISKTRRVMIRILISIVSAMNTVYCYESGRRKRSTKLVVDTCSLRHAPFFEIVI
jgi:hypothetical protein